MRVSILDSIALIDSDGIRYQLSPKEQELVAILLANPRGCSRVTIQNKLWPASPIESRQVRLSQTIAKLRKFMGADFIRTVDGELILKVALSNTELGQLDALSHTVESCPTDTTLRGQVKTFLDSVNGKSPSNVIVETIPGIMRQWETAIANLQTVLADMEAVSDAIIASHEAGTEENHHIAPPQRLSDRLIAYVPAFSLFMVVVALGIMFLKSERRTSELPPVITPVEMKFDDLVLAEDKEVAGTPTNSEGTAVRTAQNGDIYACGYMRTAETDVDGFLMRVHPKKGLVWKTRLPGIRPDCDRAFAVHAEADGSCWVAGDTYIDKPVINGGRQIPIGWHLIVWKVSSNGKVVSTTLGKFIAVESPRTAWLVSDNVGGVWAAIQSRSTTGSRPEVVHIASDQTVRTNRQVGTSTFLLASMASDRFGQVVLAGTNVDASLRHASILAIDGYGRDAAYKLIDPVVMGIDVPPVVTAGPHDNFWLTTLVRDHGKLVHRISLLSSTTFDVQVHRDISLDANVVAVSSSGDTAVVNRATLQIESAEQGIRSAFTLSNQPDSERISTIALQSPIDSATVLSLQALHRDAPFTVVRLLDRYKSQIGILRLALTEGVTKATYIKTSEEPNLARCFGDVCTGYVRVNEMRHAVVVRIPER